MADKAVVDKQKQLGAADSRELSATSQKVKELAAVIDKHEITINSIHVIHVRLNKDVKEKLENHENLLMEIKKQMRKLEVKQAHGQSTPSIALSPTPQLPLAHQPSHVQILPIAQSPLSQNQP